MSAATEAGFGAGPSGPSYAGAVAGPAASLGIAGRGGDAAGATPGVEKAAGPGGAPAQGIAASSPPSSPTTLTHSLPFLRAAQARPPFHSWPTIARARSGLKRALKK